MVVVDIYDVHGLHGVIILVVFEELHLHGELHVGEVAIISFWGDGGGPYE